MKTKTLKLRGMDASLFPVHFDSAHCRGCEWSTSDTEETTSTKVTSRARYHVNKTGHAVEVYREKGVVIKPI